MDPKLQDKLVRKATFEWLREQQAVHGDVLPRDLLLRGFQWQGRRVPLVSAQGIFKPRVLPEIPLTITSSPNGPYEDSVADDHRLMYRYRGTEPGHRDNRGLREAMRTRTPLVYLFGLIPGRYLAVWPVFIVDDAPQELVFTVMADAQDAIRDSLERGAEAELAAESSEARRAYITAAVQVRVHQRSFRERVLYAYREQCAFCRLRRRELLDASHIIPDREAGGDPTVSNGLSLCKIHHTAFDRNLLGVRRDGQVRVRRDILEEQDGPMLQHGLKGLHQQRLHTPPPHPGSAGSRTPRQTLRAISRSRGSFALSSKNVSCPFCNWENERVTRAVRHCSTRRDGRAVRNGHTLVIVARHAGSVIEPSSE